MKHTINSHLDSEDYESLKRCEICFPATAPLHNRIATLTAHNAAMQDDAVQNTYAFQQMLKANKDQAEEINELKGIASNLAKHLEAIQNICERGDEFIPTEVGRSIRKHCEAANVIEAL